MSIAIVLAFVCRRCRPSASLSESWSSSWSSSLSGFCCCCCCRRRRRRQKPKPKLNGPNGAGHWQLREGRIDPRASVFVMADTTDAGADQVARRRHMMSAVADLNGFFYLDVNCALHQFHLMVKDNLQILENFLGSLPACFSQGFEAYTSNLAKCANFWRTHVSHFIDSWEAIHGPSKASDRTKPEPVNDPSTWAALMKPAAHVSVVSNIQD